jgi:threonine dehydrogenase-like Zn-dependent dehydrogenase
MTSIRVATFEGPGAPPVIREVPRPEVPAKAALIQIGACGVCGTDLHMIAVGAPGQPRLALCRAFGAEATVCLDDHPSAAARIDAVREIVGGFGADLVIDCSGHPSAGPEGIEMLRDGGTYLEMGQFTDAGAILTNWHRICTKDINVLGSWAFTANDIPQGIAMLERARARYPWYDMQTLFPFTEAGVGDAIAAAMAMRTVKSTIVPFEGLG